jgi:DMSO/TMAO reductase YedYZ molybdopterin-dependent catalytic subunit
VSGWLPPGQAETRKFPVVGEREPLAEALDLDAWRLAVSGLVERPQELGWEEVEAFPTSELVADIHCVTGWSQRAMRFGGFPLRDLLAPARPLPAARFVRFEAFSARRHDTTLPLELAMKDTWLASRFDGVPLAPEHGFPLRAVTPSRYFYKSLKWVGRIELLAEDRLGYWERESSYHNRGDPWAGDERFTTGSVDPRLLERFKSAESFDRYRGPKNAMLGLDLRAWRPASRDQRELHLKSCDLRRAKLAGCDLRGSNLSLSDLRGADLAGADLRRADLEGANFAGADLTGADLRDALLSATRFFERGDGGEIVAARIDGLRWQGATGLLEDQEDYLRGRRSSGV